MPSASGIHVFSINLTGRGKVVTVLYLGNVFIRVFGLQVKLSGFSAKAGHIYTEHLGRGMKSLYAKFNWITTDKGHILDRTPLWGFRFGSRKQNVDNWAGFCR